MLSVASLTVSPGASGDSVPPAPDRTSCTYTEETVPDTLSDACDDPGDVIAVKLSNEITPVVNVEIPPAGYGVSAIADLANGEAYTLQVLPRDDGTTDVSFIDSAEASTGSSSGSPSKCTDYDFKYLFLKDSNGNQIPGKLVWDAGPIKWYFNASSTPSGLSQAGVSADLQHGAAVISNTSSPCYSNDVNPVTQEFKGNYSGAGNVNANNTCDSPSDFSGTDMVNSVAFGPIDNSNVLAQTCLWLATGGKVTIRGELSWRIVGADIRFDDNHNWETSGEACTSSGTGLEYSIDGVATHEFGHVWGMGHVTEADHGNLTMSTNSAPCEFSQSALGIGDVSGIGHLYNVLN